MERLRESFLCLWGGEEAIRKIGKLHLSEFIYQRLVRT